MTTPARARRQDRSGVGQIGAPFHEPPAASSLTSAIFEGSVDGIMVSIPVLDETEQVVDFEWIAVNPAAMAITELDADELIGQRLLETWPIPETHEMFRHYVTVLETGEDFTTEISTPRDDDRPGWFQITCLQYHDGDRGGIVVFLRDITEHRNYLALLADIREKHQILERQALHDPLTGLANRLLLEERLEHALTRRLSEPWTVAAIFIDVDRFKEVNDTFGHEVGDRLLTTLANRLEVVVRQHDTIARLGGDEFVVVCEDISPLDVPRIAHRLREQCAAPLDIDGRQLAVSASIGVAFAQGERIDAAALIKEADGAMYEAKQAGGDRVGFSSASTGILDEHQLVGDSLRSALASGRISVHFDPIVRAADRRLVAADVRLDWAHPERGRFDHAGVVAAAGSVGMLATLDRWLLERALAQLARWRDDGRHDPPVLVVDISADLLRTDELARWLGRLLGEHGVRADQLGLGLDDELLGNPGATTIEAVNALADLGVLLERVGVGSNNSPTQYAHEFPLRFARIGQELAAASDEAGTVIRAIAEVAHRRGRILIADGVTDEEHHDALRELGIDLLQGPYLAELMDADQLTNHIWSG